MPSKRIKSLMHGSAPDTRVYHRSHGSKKRYDHKKFRTQKRSFDKSELKGVYMDAKARQFIDRFNNDKEFRRHISEVAKGALYFK